MMKGTRARGAVRVDHSIAAGHAEMRHPHQAIVKMFQDEFGAPRDFFDPGLRDFLGKAAGKRKSQPGTAQGEGLNPPPLNKRPQTPADSFHFRQFRHDVLYAISSHSASKHGAGAWAKCPAMAF